MVKTLKTLTTSSCKAVGLSNNIIDGQRITDLDLSNKLNSYYRNVGGELVVENLSGPSNHVSLQPASIGQIKY